MVKRKAIRKLNKPSNRIKNRRQTSKNKKIAPPPTEKLWSRDLDLKGNFQNLQLTYDLNSIKQLSSKNIPSDIPQTIEVTEEYTLEQIKQMNEGTFSEAKPKISQDEGFIVRNLYKKYKEDYDRMVMDHKINIMQWNANQIKKKFDAFKKKFGSVDQDFKLWK